MEKDIVGCDEWVRLLDAITVGNEGNKKACSKRTDENAPKSPGFAASELPDGDEDEGSEG